MNVAECKKNFQKRIQQRISANEELRHKVLRKSVPLIVDWFQKNSEVEKVYLFGSILNKGDFTTGSDIDIGVVGLKKIEYFKVWARLEEILNIQIDLRTVDQDTPFALSVKKNGRLIYDRRSTTY